MTIFEHCQERVMACNECHVTSCYFNEHCACMWENIIADIIAELRIDVLSRLLVTICICPKDFLEIKTSFSIKGPRSQCFPHTLVGP